MVVTYHLPGALGMLDLRIPVLNSGVDLFFVISGFVMVLSTENRRSDHRAFLMQRFTRVVPFYWVMTFLMVAALWCLPVVQCLLSRSPIACFSYPISIRSQAMSNQCLAWVGRSIWKSCFIFCSRRPWVLAGGRKWPRSALSLQSP
ncbi:acyltransferase family protein [Mesorhizobium sp. M0045]|uniref:acyltransferase family protein n=1 Tax=Mesorhizobium sp. M0045 TaxID=2956857 RepID=UPI003334EF0C